MALNTFPCNPYPISTEELNKGNNDDLNARVATLEGDVTDLNSNKANQITIAPFFNEETAYDPGDLVYYNGLSYRCVNAHEGDWDADDFAATTVSNEIDALKSGLITHTTETVSGTTNSSGVLISTYGASTKLVMAYMENYMVFPYINGGVWKFVICDSSSTSGIVQIKDTSVTINVVIESVG